MLHLMLSLLPDLFLLGSPSLLRSSMLAQLRSRPRRLVHHLEELRAVPQVEIMLVENRNGKGEASRMQPVSHRNFVTTRLPSTRVCRVGTMKKFMQWFLANGS